MSKDERCNIVIDRIFRYRPVSTRTGQSVRSKAVSQRCGARRAREAAVRKVTPAFARPFHLELGLAA